MVHSWALKDIRREDLEGLEKLEAFWIYNSELRSLQSNLFFKGMNELKNILVVKNKLEYLNCLSRSLEMNYAEWTFATTQTSTHFIDLEKKKAYIRIHITMGR
jgi:hypothetical protein